MSRRMTKMSSAAEKSREQVEGVVRRATRRTALSVSFKTLVAVLIVDFACRRGRQYFVRFGDFAELFTRRLVAPAIFRQSLFYSF